VYLIVFYSLRKILGIASSSIFCSSATTSLQVITIRVNSTATSSTFGVEGGNLPSRVTEGRHNFFFIFYFLFTKGKENFKDLMKGKCLPSTPPPPPLATYIHTHIYIKTHNYNNLRFFLKI
jgi:hypothetical protein